MHLFGLTGGLASGKSVVAARLRAHGVPILDADALAREVVAKGTSGLAEIVHAFGPAVLGAEGTLDRRRLAALVFGEKAKLETLNAIVHPRIAELGRARARELAERGELLGGYEAALLVESGRADDFRPLVVVAAMRNVQLARAMLRDGESETQVRARLDAQMPLESKIAAADIVIENTSSFERLHEKTDEALVAICARLGIDPSRYEL